MKYKSKILLTSLKGKNVYLEDVVIYPTIAALATHPELIPLIEETFFEYTKEHPIDIFSLKEQDDYLIYFESYPFNKSIPMYQLYSIINLKEKYESEEKAYEYVESLIIKGHKRIYDYYKRNPKLQIENISDFIESRYGGDIENLRMLLISMYLFLQATNEGINIHKSPYFVEYYCYNLSMQVLLEILLDNEIVLKQEEERRALEAFKKRTSIRLQRDTYISDIFNGMEKTAISSLTSKELFQVKNSPNKITLLYKKGFPKYLKMFFGDLAMKKLDDVKFPENIKYSRKHLFDAYSMYLLNVQDGRFEANEDTLDLIIAFSIFSAVVFTRYDELVNDLEKTYHLLNQTSIRNAEAELKLKQKKIEEQVRETNSNMSQIESRNKDLMAYIEKLENELKSKNDIEEEYESLKREVVVLRETVFNEPEENTFIIESSTYQEYEKSILLNSKVALFGGHSNFANRLKEDIPHLRHIEVTDKTLDLSFVHQMDIIIFFTSYNNHTLYNRFRKEWNKDSMKVIFISKKTNIPSLEKKIIDSLLQDH